MKSLVVNLLIELNNLETELNLLLNGEFDDSSEQEIEDLISSFKNRLVGTLLTFSRLLEEYRDSEDIELNSDVKISTEELIVSAVSNLLLNFVLKISLTTNCNLTSSRVIWNKLSKDSEGKTSLQKTFKSLLEKVMELDE